MNIRWRAHAYSDGGKPFEARVYWDDDREEARPGVLVSHAWRGRSDFENGRAEALARLGYVGFALDLYGKGILGRSNEENQRLMQPYMQDRVLLQQRMKLALAEIRKLPEVDAARIAAMGFCFGGLCVLDLARCGADLRAVASFHGLLDPPGNTAGTRFEGMVLVLHGWDDPMAPPEKVVRVGQELSAMGADWQVHAYGNTMHAFTNPAAADPSHGLMFNARANDRSNRELQSFLSEAFW